MRNRHVPLALLSAAMLLSALSAQSCRQRQKNAETKLNVYNGQPTTDFPYVAKLTIYFEKGRGGCSSTFVSDSTAFTAGHCVEKLPRDIHSEGRRPLFYIKQPNADFAILVYERNTYTGSTFPKITSNQFPEHMPVLFVGYGNNAREENTCYVEDATDSNPYCSFMIKGKNYGFVKAKPDNCSVTAAEKFLNVQLAYDPTLKEACLNLRGEISISEGQYREVGFGIRRRGNGEISSIDKNGGPIFTDQRRDYDFRDPRLQFPMHGDSGGAWFVENAGAIYLIAVHTLGLGRIHAGSGVNEKSPVFSWLKDQVRYDLVNVPDLETGEALQGYPPEAIRLTETFAIPKVAIEGDIFAALASAEHKKNYYHLAVATARPYREAWYCSYADLHDCAYDLVKDQSAVTALTEMTEKTSTRKFLRTKNAVHLSSGGDGGFSVLMRSSDGSYFGTAVSVEAKK